MSGGMLPNRERAFGRIPPKNAPALPFRAIWTGVTPTRSPAVDHFARRISWGLWGNDWYGVCGPVSYGNLRKLITAWLAGTEQDVTQDDIFALYKLVNPSFNPDTGAGDDGVDLQTMLELVLEHGFGPEAEKPLAFAKVNAGDLDEVRAAIEIFGGVILGVNLQTAQEGQTDNGGPWDYSRSGEWGGHATMGGRYADPAGTTQDRTGNVTWAELVDFTDAFAAHQLEEVWVVIFPEHLGTTQFVEGIDQARLANAYKALTGQDWPAPTPPAPEPTDPLAELAALIRQGLATVEAWLKKHGL